MCLSKFLLESSAFLASAGLGMGSGSLTPPPAGLGGGGLGLFGGPRFSTAPGSGKQLLDCNFRDLLLVLIL